jgi:hypothetical protein
MVTTQFSLPVKIHAAHWAASFIAIFYGFAKLNGAQFTILDSELARPLGDVSGFWLTWHYFGYSPVYGSLIGVVQIIAGVLILVPRASLLAALILFPLSANILLIDIFYGVALSGTAAALLLLSMVLITLVPHVPRLKEALLLNAPVRPTTGTSAGLLLLLVGCWSGTWWIANRNNRAPTPIDGVWSVTDDTSSERVRWQYVFFERNRAHLAVFRAADGVELRRHFEVNGDRIQVWERWLAKGDLTMQGRITPDGAVILDPLAGGRLVLQRAARRRPSRLPNLGP